MVPKNAFFGAMDCSLREASRKEQSIAPSKPSNDGRIYESSRHLHCSDTKGTLDLITWYHMFTRTDIQRSKQGIWEGDAGRRACRQPPPTTRPQGTDRGSRGHRPIHGPSTRSDAGTPEDATSREAPTQSSRQTQADCDAWATTPDMPKRATNRGPSPGGHTRDEDSFAAFMKSFAFTPPRGGKQQHGGRRLRPSGRTARTPHHH